MICLFLSGNHYLPYWHFESQKGNVVLHKPLCTLLVTPMDKGFLHVDVNMRNSTSESAITAFPVIWGFPDVVLAETYTLERKGIRHVSYTVGSGQNITIVDQRSRTWRNYLHGCVVHIQKHGHPGKLIRTRLLAPRNSVSSWTPPTDISIWKLITRLGAADLLGPQVLKVIDAVFPSH